MIIFQLIAPGGKSIPAVPVTLRTSKLICKHMADQGDPIDTIAAISTPPARGGIGIVRLSGPQSASIAGQLVTLRQPLAHARTRLADVLDTDRPKRQPDAAPSALTRRL